jgi:uncharacterized protein (TIGR00296 family)
MVLKKNDGEYLLKIARKAISEYINNHTHISIPENCPEYLKEKLGVFCTINENSQLRGCIGYPEPVKPLIEALIDVAISAATADPRFPVINKEELNKIDLEITVLTKPELIIVNDNSEYPEHVSLGEDGLIVKRNFNSGLLLPQVPLEFNMNKNEFLSHTCLKAGLYPDVWKEDPNIQIYKFQGQIFKE